MKAIKIFRKALRLGCNAVKTDAFIGCDRIKNDDGLSLIEVAMAVIIIGLVAMPVLELNKINRMKESYYTTSANLDTSLDALNISFIVGLNAYACPASLTATEGDADYGVSNPCVLADIKECTDNSWKTNGGVCKTTNGANAIIVGAVPFATLNIKYTDTLDYWSNKLIYAVTHAQTDATTYTDDGGEITMFTVDNPQTVSNATAPISGSEDGVPDALATLYDLIIFSTGRTGLGGFDQSGSQIGNCDDPADSYDHENCDFDSIFFAEKHPDDLMAKAYNQNRGDSTFFDDQSVIQSSVPQGEWYLHPENLTYTHQYAITSAEKISIGTAEPDTKTTVHVEGPVRIETSATDSNTGMLKSASICSTTNDFSTCFNPAIVSADADDGDADDDLNCRSIGSSHYGHQGVRKIGNSTAYCGKAVGYGETADESTLSADRNVVKNKNCGSGQLITGFNPGGVATCSGYITE